MAKSIQASRAIKKSQQEKACKHYFMPRKCCAPGASEYRIHTEILAETFPDGKLISMGYEFLCNECLFQAQQFCYEVRSPSDNLAEIPYFDENFVIK